MLRLALLPGMDGTGDLFADFIRALPETIPTSIVRYPRDRPMSYSQLENLVSAAMPRNEPIVLLAESFSTPIAIRFAARNPPNLKALILCAGFATNPVRGWKRFAAPSLAPLAFRLPLNEPIASRFLLGRYPPNLLLESVRAAISSVEPRVLSARLRAVLACDVRTDLAQVVVPVLYLQASQDRLVPQSCLEEIKRILPHIEIAAIAGPHLILQREPRQAAEAVAKFVHRVMSEA